MTNFLITGGAGFVGHHLINSLLSTSHKIVVVDSMINGKYEYLQSWKDRIQFYKEDIRNNDEIEKIIKKENIDTCVHLAAKISVAESMIHPEETIDVNVKGTLNLLEASAKNNVQKFIFASSAAIYGEPKIFPVPEEHQIQPRSPYGASKIAGEALVQAYKNSGKLKSAIILRFFNIYGEGKTKEYAGVLAKFIDAVKNNAMPQIFGDGKQVRDFISVKDVVEVIKLALQTDTSGIFNVGTGKPTTVYELAKLIMKILNSDGEPMYLPARSGDVYQSYADNTKIKEFLGFDTFKKLEDGLRELI